MNINTSCRLFPIFYIKISLTSYIGRGIGTLRYVKIIFRKFQGEKFVCNNQRRAFATLARATGYIFPFSAACGILLFAFDLCSAAEAIYCEIRRKQTQARVALHCVRIMYIIMCNTRERGASRDNQCHVTADYNRGKRN